MEKITLPRPGWRIIKTGLSIMICLLLYHLVFHRANPMVACLSAIFSLRETTSHSLSFGKARIIGNGIGGVLAFICIIIVYYPSYHFIKEVIAIPLALMVFIYIMTLMNYKGGIIGGSAALLMIFFTSLTSEPLITVCFRFLDTIVGTIVAIAVNYFIHPPKPLSTEEKKANIKQQMDQLQKEYNQLKG